MGFDLCVRMCVCLCDFDKCDSVIALLMMMIASLAHHAGGVCSLPVFQLYFLSFVLLIAAFASVAAPTAQFGLSGGENDAFVFGEWLEIDGLNRSETRRAPERLNILMMRSGFLLCETLITCVLRIVRLLFNSFHFHLVMKSLSTVLRFPFVCVTNVTLTQCSVCCVLLDCHSPEIQ